MQCIKTGCHAQVAGYYVYGDAFEIGGALIIRVCQMEHHPIGDSLHFEADTWEQWFDRHKTSQSQNSTLFIGRGHWERLGGYEGVPVGDKE